MKKKNRYLLQQQRDGVDDENIPTPQISVTEIQNTKYPLGICMYKFTYNGQENLAFTLVFLLLNRYTDVNNKRICPYGCSIHKKKGS